MEMTSTILPILAKNDFVRMTVILPATGLWPAENIAYFCSTGKSGVKDFNGTYFPIFGSYIEGLTPIPDIGSDITLSENYLVKVSSLTFLRPASDKMQEWIYLLLEDYYKSRGIENLFRYSLDDVRYIRDITELRQLDSMYREMNLVYRCLSSYFTDVWQVKLSICLSDTLQTGVWLSQLKEFADYMKSISEPCTIEDDISTTKMSEYDFLTRNNAQCDFTTLHELPIKWYATRSSHMHDSLFKNLQSIEMSLRIAERVKPKGGKSRKKARKNKTKHKSFKRIS